MLKLMNTTHCGPQKIAMIREVQVRILYQATHLAISSISIKTPGREQYVWRILKYHMFDLFHKASFRDRSLAHQPFALYCHYQELPKALPPDTRSIIQSNPQHLPCHRKGSDIITFHRTIGIVLFFLSIPRSPTICHSSPSVR